MIEIPVKDVIESHGSIIGQLKRVDFEPSQDLVLEVEPTDGSDNVVCEIPAEHAPAVVDELHALVGTKVAVVGRMEREPYTGRLLNLEVKRVVPVTEELHRIYLDVEGILSHIDLGMPPEDYINWLREDDDESI